MLLASQESSKTRVILINTSTLFTAMLTLQLLCLALRTRLPSELILEPPPLRHLLSRRHQVLSLSSSTEAVEVTHYVFISARLLM